MHNPHVSHMWQCGMDDVFWNVDVWHRGAGLIDAGASQCALYVCVWRRESAVSEMK